jgi:hypothetical protein
MKHASLSTEWYTKDVGVACVENWFKFLVAFCSLGIWYQPCYLQKQKEVCLLNNTGTELHLFIALCNKCLPQVFVVL